MTRHTTAIAVGLAAALTVWGIDTALQACTDAIYQAVTR